MSKRKEHLPEFEAPKRKLCSDRELQVKELLQKQMNVELNLHRELEKDNVFETSTQTISQSEFAPGTKTYQELQEKQRRQRDIEKLSKQGLIQNDITMYFEYVDEGIDFIRNKYHNHEPDLLNYKLSDLINKVKHNGPNYTEDSTETPVAVHPSDNIKELESNFMYSICSQSSNEFESLNVAQIRRKARKEQTRLDKHPILAINNDEGSSTSSSLWDKTEPEIATKSKASSSRSKNQYTCQPQCVYTIRNGEIVKLNDNTDGTSEIKVTGQLSLQKIVKLPAFVDYTSGNPSNVLYVKNLPKKISEGELSNLFKDRPAMEYKIMGGKMRGQAFLTYDSVYAANEALQSMNGLIVNGKPIILQFGRKK